MSGWSVCPVCSSVVAVPEVHAAWHIAQEPPPPPVEAPVEVEPVEARWWPADVALVATPEVIEQPVEPDPAPVEVVDEPAPVELAPVEVIAEETV